MSVPTFITPDTPAQPPNHDIEGATLDDYEWLLSRFTAPDWSVRSIEWESEHTVGTTILLECTLSHESGSIVQCNPVDPVQNRACGKKYNAHRVRLRNRLADENHYLTVKSEVLSEQDPKIFDDYIRVESHPQADADACCQAHPQEEVHTADQGKRRKHTYHIATLQEAIFAIFAATQRVSTDAQRQTGLSSFATQSK